MAAPNKDTIYIDIDDEITGIIDKVRGSNGKVVALVLPKRASVFQSIVNMKLLKRAADESKKNLVLITGEAGLMPLAGAAGIHVAKTLTSKPEIPTGPLPDNDLDEVVDEEEPLDQEVTAESDGETPVGELAGAGAAGAAAAAAAKNADGVETVELDNDETPETAIGAAGAAAAAKATPKKDKKLAIPNFDRFRTWLILGGAALVLFIILLIVALTALPKAKIYIKTNASIVPVNLDLKLSTTAKTLHASDNTVPAKVVTQQKTYTQQVTTTGQKNLGNKAQGTVTMSAGSCSGNVPADVPAGVGLGHDGLTYILNDGVSFIPTVSHGKCTFQGINSSGKSDIAIIAQSGGSNYNTSGSFSVSGRSDVSASGSASGGTDNNVQVVSQADINNAKSKINTNDNSIKQTLVDDLKKDDLYAITATFSAGTPTTSSSADVGTTASSVTVTENVTYTMFGVHEEDLKTLVNDAAKDQIDTDKQSILSDGLDKATFNVNSQTATDAQVSMATNVVAGPELNTEDIRQVAAGKKPGDVRRELEANPDVTDVQVKLSPFWVGSVPKKTSKITVIVAKPTNTTKANASNP
jgi:predicted DNA binding protein